MELTHNKKTFHIKIMKLDIPSLFNQLIYVTDEREYPLFGKQIKENETIKNNISWAKRELQNLLPIL